MRRVALMRAIEDARRSADSLRALGFEPMCVPAIEITATGAEPPAEALDGVLATSAKAFAFLSRPACARLAGLRLYVVGETTAGAARAAGLGPVEVVGGDASALALGLLPRLPPGARLLYLAGRDRKDDLESSLRGLGHHVVATEVYVAKARPAWSAAEAEAFASCAIALHYSRRSAELTISLAEAAGVDDRLRAILHVCISTDASEVLRLRGAQRIVTATGAREDLLFDALMRAAETL